MQLELIHKENIPRSLEKAKHYRTLAEPELAASICQDILAVEPENQEALVIYVLTLIDQLSNKSHIDIFKETIALLSSDYHKNYYQGLFFERRARAFLKNNMTRNFAYASFMQALEFYKKAKELSPAELDDAILRINSCLRTIEKEHLEDIINNDE